MVIKLSNHESGILLMAEFNFSFGEVVCRFICELAAFFGKL